MRSREDNAIFTSVPIEDIEFYKQTNEELQQENKQLKERIDEAIEYIKYCQTSDDDIFPVIEAEKMLEILEGKSDSSE